MLLFVYRAEKDDATTLTIDEDLFAEATQLTGLQVRSALVREAFKALIVLESSQRLARLGGSEPNIEVSLRRKSVAE